jgi:hypothetical protein
MLESNLYKGFRMYGRVQRLYKYIKIVGFVSNDISPVLHDSCVFKSGRVTCNVVTYFFSLHLILSEKYISLLSLTSLDSISLGQIRLEGWVLNDTSTCTLMPFTNPNFLFLTNHFIVF